MRSSSHTCSTTTVSLLLGICSISVGNVFHDWPGYFVFIPSYELRYVKGLFGILRHMQTGPSKNDVGPLETVVLETKHQQIALKAVEAAYLIECPLALGTRAPEPILDWGRGPPARPSCQHRREPNNPRARHMVQTQHPKIHSHPMPTPGCADLHRHCDSAPLACPWVRPVPDAFTLPEKEKQIEAKKILPSFTLPARGEDLSI